MKQPRSTVDLMKRAERKAVATAHEASLHKLRTQEIVGPVQDTGTGFTILKLQRNQPPLRTLVEGKKIGTIEIEAAKEIELAAMSVGNMGRLAAICLERIDRGRQGDNPWPATVAIAVRNYQSWQMYWSREHKLTGNPMLEIVWCAVIDERPISTISQECGYGRHLVTRGIIAGLRHYAAWAKMITGTQADRWLGEAAHVFDRRLLINV